jgi:hypothetical protein
MTQGTRTPLEGIDGLTRIETTPFAELVPLVYSMTKESYPHDEVYGQFCCVQSFIAAPPKFVFDYMAPVESLEEWTYSLREMGPTEQPGVVVGRDTIGPDTRIWCRSVANSEALTVDYHCAWDQGDHPFYDENPFPEAAPPSRPMWVGDIWRAFYAGHLLELQNLKRIVEHRYAEAQSA